MERRLYRSSTDRKLTGISGGLADYLDVEPVLVRITWVVVTIFTGGVAALAYVALVFIIPMKEFADEDAPEVSEGEPEIDSEEGPEPASPRGRPRRHARRDPVAESRRRLIGGVLLVLIGVLFLLNNFDLFGGLDLSRFWPLLIIVPGLLMIVGRLRGARHAKAAPPRNPGLRPDTGPGWWRPSPSKSRRNTMGAVAGAVAALAGPDHRLRGQPDRGAVHTLAGDHPGRGIACRHRRRRRVPRRTGR